MSCRPTTSLIGLAAAVGCGAVWVSRCDHPIVAERAEEPVQVRAVQTAAAEVPSPIDRPQFPRASPTTVGFDLASFLSVVHPMKHRLSSRLPLLVWNLPMSRRHEDLLALAQEGKLRWWVKQLAERGIVPVIRLVEDQPVTGSLALARALKEAGRPIHLLLPQTDFIEKYAWKRTEVGALGPDARAGGRIRRWPCLPLAESDLGAEAVERLLAPFWRRGVVVSAVWSDFERLPNPHNGVYHAQRTSAECRKHYPADVLDDFESFTRYTFDLRTRLLSEMLADPVHKLYPNATVGNYKCYASSEAAPFFNLSGTASPPRSLGRLNVMMPKAYASNRYLPRYVGRAQKVAKEQADRVHFAVLLRTITSAAQNKKQNIQLVPFISRKVVTRASLSSQAGMSPGLYRELILHSLLRGVDGFYLFNGGPKAGVSAAESYQSVEDARAVYDELLGHRDFLDRGQPMNLDWPEPGEARVVWSGLRLGDRCLVRSFALGNQAQEVKIRPWPESPTKVMLPAPPEGLTSLVYRDGRIQHLGGT